MRTIALLLGCLAAGGHARGQDDLRDVVQLKDGKELRGRVVDPFASTEIVLAQGGKRVRVPKKDIASTDLVTARVREFLQRRARQQDNPKLLWFLVEWARAHELPGIARLQALQLVLHDDADERAHEYLGHKRSGKNWLWAQDGKWSTREQLEASLPKRELELVGEHFRVRCDGGIKEAVAAAFDLERLYVWWLDEYGAELQLHEVLTPMTVQLYRNSEVFPKWGFKPQPYFVPEPHGDIGRTFYGGNDLERPRLLFFVGTQAILYHALALDARVQTDRDRICPWLEIGLGMAAQNVLQGPPGNAAPAAPKLQDLQALQALGRTYRLTHLLHLPMYGSFYLMDDSTTAVNWAAATMFVSYLLEPNNDPATRARFLAYVHGALRERGGDSSTLFDQAMGQRIENFEPGWRAWLEKKAGF